MNILNITRFRMSGNELNNMVRDGETVKVVARSGLRMNVRELTVDDTDLTSVAWSVASKWSAVKWRKFFDAQAAQDLPPAQVVSLDSVPSFVVELWRATEEDTK